MRYFIFYEYKIITQQFSIFISHSNWDLIIRKWSNSSVHECEWIECITLSYQMIWLRYNQINSLSIHFHLQLRSRTSKLFHFDLLLIVNEFKWSDWFFLIVLHDDESIVILFRFIWLFSSLHLFYLIQCDNNRWLFVMKSTEYELNKSLSFHFLLFNLFIQ